MADERPKARSNLFTVWRNREAELGKRITYRDAAAATGISAATLSRWASGDVDRFGAVTIQALCKYFQCQVGELILLEGEGDSDAP